MSHKEVLIHALARRIDSGMMTVEQAPAPFEKAIEEQLDLIKQQKEDVVAAKKEHDEQVELEREFEEDKEANTEEEEE